MKNVIKEVTKDSIAEEVGIEPEDILLKINGTEINDIIDYRFI
jgi:NifB/MoaA-like Fe-S oxidoreductase